MTNHANHHLRLFLLYDRRTFAEAKTTGAAQSSEPLPPPPLAAVAKPPRAASRPSETTSECGRTPWCSSSTSPPPLSLLRPEQRDPGDLPVQNPVRDLLQKFDKSQGSNCEVSDSDE